MRNEMYGQSAYRVLQQPPLGVYMQHISSTPAIACDFTTEDELYLRTFNIRGHVTNETHIAGNWSDLPLYIHRTKAKGAETVIRLVFLASLEGTPLQRGTSVTCLPTKYRDTDASGVKPDRWQSPRRFPEV